MVELAQQINLILSAPTEYNAKNFKKAFKEDTLEILELFMTFLKEAELNEVTDYHKVIEAVVEQKERLWENRNAFTCKSFRLNDRFRTR